MLTFENSLKLVLVVLLAVLTFQENVEAKPALYIQGRAIGKLRQSRPTIIRFRRKTWQSSPSLSTTTGFQIPAASSRFALRTRTAMVARSIQAGSRRLSQSRIDFGVCPGEPLMTFGVCRNSQRHRSTRCGASTATIWGAAPAPGSTDR